MKRSLLIAVMCLAGASVLVSGCKPKAGATCKIETKEVCATEKQALVCHDSKWEEMTCRGPAGCTKTGNESACDQTVAEDKDVCNLVNDYVCSGDKKGMLECTKNHWSFVQSCLGDRGCVMEAKKVTCDNSIANTSDACREEDDYACSPDKKNALVCRSGKFTVASNCKGKNACRVTGDKSAGFKVECDDSIANFGDPCDKEGHFSCAPDEKQIVKCVGKKFVGDDKCTKKQEKCAVKGELVGCY
jgi:hypothetical protein